MYMLPAFPSEVPFRWINLSIRHDIWCLVDEDDYNWLIKFNWNWAWHDKTPWKHYAKLNVGVARSTIYLHRLVMIKHDPRTELFRATHHVDHINGQSLDNRKANLRWVTPGENIANRIARNAVPSLKQIALRLLAEHTHHEMPF